MEVLTLAAALGCGLADELQQRADNAAFAACWRDQFVAFGVLEPDEAGRWLCLAPWLPAGEEWERLRGEYEALDARWRAITPDTPTARDLDWLPPADDTHPRDRETRAWLRHLEWERAWCVTDREVAAAELFLADARWRLRLTELVREARGGWSARGRRLALAELREELGPYYWGRREFPAPLPGAAYREDWR